MGVGSALGMQKATGDTTLIGTRDAAIGTKRHSFPGGNSVALGVKQTFVSEMLSRT